MYNITDIEVYTRRHFEVDGLMVAEHAHRMANDLAGMIAELESCRRRLRDEAAAKAIECIIDRLRDACGVQQCLMPPIDGDVDLSLVIEKLATAVVRAHARCADLDLSLKLAPITVEAQLAWRMSVIINELLTNAIKYGTRCSKSRITVSLTASNGYITSVVTDDGPGAHDWSAKGTGHGFSLIRAIASRLHGKVERSTSDHGTEVRVAFPQFSCSREMSGFETVKLMTA